MNINNWKIGTRISAGFGAVIVVTLLLVAVAYTQLVSINAAAKRITEGSLPGVSLSSQIEIKSLQRIMLLRDYIRATDPVLKAGLEADGLRVQSAITVILAEYEKAILEEKDRELFKAVQAARAPYVASMREAGALVASNNQTRALEVLAKQIKPQFQLFSEALEALVAYNSEHGTSSGKAIEASVSAARLSLLIGLAIALLIAIGTSVVVTRGITKPLANSIAHLEKVSSGDFSQDLSADALRRGDEIGVQARAMQSMSLSLRTMIRDVTAGIQTFSASSASLLTSSVAMSSGSRDATHKAQMVAAAAEEMSSNVTMVASSMEQTTTNLANVAASTQEMTDTIGEIAVNSEKARGITSEATRQAARITEQMQELGQAAREIGKVTEAITEISSQTNLLALNATIEAARAGTAGKGFAVVANEIKALAQQTAKATEDIKARISGVQNSTAQGVAEIEKVSIVIRQVSDIVGSIAAAIEEQATATKNIAHNIAEASTGVQDANVRVAESSQVSIAIATDIVVVHRVATEMAGGSDHVSASATDLATVADKLKLAVSSFRI